MSRSRNLGGALLATALGCTTSGQFKGEMAPSSPASATELVSAPHEHVRFAWTSNDGGQSGDMKVVLPSGETFAGTFHQFTRTTTATNIGGFHGSWYGGPWGYGYGWGGAWPYYDDLDTFIVYYTGRVLAVLESPAGVDMRCRFELVDGRAGMSEGGEGECQIEDGRDIRAWFGPSDAPASS